MIDVRQIPPFQLQQKNINFEQVNCFRYGYTYHIPTYDKLLDQTHSKKSFRGMPMVSQEIIPSNYRVFVIKLIITGNYDFRRPLVNDLER